jgi:hypothetical protein
MKTGLKIAILQLHWYAVVIFGHEYPFWSYAFAWILLFGNYFIYKVKKSVIAYLGLAIAFAL